ncbi:MAG: sel1 repeat family protein [Betaproteobacteria bacterium]|nr:sel1 repeat family protein [Betaproteobacteria bacterium]MDH5219741.1 sel1 repeat family protein [Betaproteobacteria bacterium]MDH5350488.1 sel1 repeat family protein [Betaproteobacteria bacterium]
MRAFAAVLLAATLARAQAAPEDDYRRGEEAYRRGDVVVAMAALRGAAEAGHAPSQVLLGSILDQAEYDVEALSWYRKAAQQGDAAGAYGVGTMYLSGEGVRKDPAEAYAWFLRAAAKQHAPAVIAIASAYLAAENAALPPGLGAAQAADWLRKAAALDHLAAVDALARAYRVGAFGVAPDAKEAEAFAARAAAIRGKAGPEKGRKKR